MKADYDDVIIFLLSELCDRAPPAQQRALFVSERELGGGEEDVPRSCSLLAAEGNGRLERLRAFPAEPWLRADAARLRLCLLLLCAALC